MEMLIRVARTLRLVSGFAGYIHLKIIPGCWPLLVREAGFWADRLSVNIELPSERSLRLLAPEKTGSDILGLMRAVRGTIEQNQLARAPASCLPAPRRWPERPSMAGDVWAPAPPPLAREHRLYEADWLLRFYGFSAAEVLDEAHPFLDLDIDPKTAWTLRNRDQFPVEVDRAGYAELLRVPGLGQKSARRIVEARAHGRVGFDMLERIDVVMRRARWFLTCGGRSLERVDPASEVLRLRLAQGQSGQLPLFTEMPA